MTGMGVCIAQSWLGILFVIPTFGRSDHSLLHQPDQLVQVQMRLTHYLSLLMLGLAQQNQKLLLLPAQQDVTGKGSDQLLPNSRVPLRKGLQLRED